MRALDWSSVIAVAAETDLGRHAVGIADLNVLCETIVGAVEVHARTIVSIMTVAGLNEG